MNAPAISAAIAEACAMGGFKSKEVVTSVSGHSVIVKRISLPAQSKEELEETIRWEAEQYIPFDINEVNIDHQILRESGDRRPDGRAAGRRQEGPDRRLPVSVITESGLSLVVMDVDAFAVGNMYQHNYEPADETTVALLDLGASVINMNVMNGSVPVFTRDITSGGNQYTEEIQKTLGITFEEAERIKVGGRPGETSKDVVPQEVEEAMREVSETMLGEIQRSLDFYRATAASSRLERLLLCGGAARVPGLDRIFHDKLEIPSRSPIRSSASTSRSSAGDEERIRELGPALCTAIGLGMRRGDDT